MNSKQYNNIINHTLVNEPAAQTEDSLTTARAIFNNMGVALPSGDLPEIMEVLQTNEYMGWKACTREEAQQAANNGIAAIGICEDQIVIFAAEDEDEPVARTAQVLTLSETTIDVAEAEAEYFAYSVVTTTIIPQPPESGFYFEDTTVSVVVGWTGHIQPTGSTGKPIWTSSNPLVAEVDSTTGLITAKKLGNTVINATVPNSDLQASFTLTVEKLKIYQTRNTYTNDKNNNLANDLKYNDLTVDELRAMDWISWADFALASTRDLINAWESMCVLLFSTPPLQAVIQDMIAHFLSGSGTEYSNGTLSQKVHEHESTQTYFNNVKECIRAILSQHNGDITALTYSPEERDSSLMVRKLSENSVYEPNYDTNDDRKNGLTICLDGLWGNEIFVKKYTRSGNSFSGVLEINLYDHFGLDAPDVEKYGLLGGFRAWYILQHCKDYNGAYKPFVTMISFEVPFEGTF